MSEQRKPKRLDEREVATLHEFIKAEAGVAADVVAADHLRAIDDRKLLILLVSRSAAIASGTWSKAEREAWEEIRREVKP